MGTPGKDGGFRDITVAPASVKVELTFDADFSIYVAPYYINLLQQIAAVATDTPRVYLTGYIEDNV